MKADAKTALEDVVEAWESLPGGKHYSPREIQAWLAEHMKPAIDNAREVLAEDRDD